MPWGTGDVSRHTKKARTPKRQRQWRHIANGALARGKSEGAAIRMANGVIRNGGRRGKRARRTRR